jgi:putative addiction module component (TIGR02574 family)
MAILSQEDVRQLSPGDRLDLISRLWDSLEDSNLGLTQAQMSELDRRLAHIEEDRERTVAWETLRDNLP